MNLKSAFPSSKIAGVSPLYLATFSYRGFGHLSFKCFPQRSISCKDIEQGLMPFHFYKGGDGSMVRNTVALPEEGPRFDPLHPHDRSNLSVTTVSMGSSAFFWVPWALHAYGAQTYRKAKHPYT